MSVPLSFTALFKLITSACKRDKVSSHKTQTHVGTWNHLIYVVMMKTTLYINSQLKLTQNTARRVKLQRY